ncbi:hypothetical protein STTU_1007 [Streptomyces sp. Tu6071]|nr:hypothetical protein STTU_1007 [Streptomyces sp. Tu6071]
MATPAKGRFIGAAHAADGPVTQRRRTAVEEPAILVERLPAHRTSTPQQDDTTSLPTRQARAAAAAAVGAVLSLIDNWLSDGLVATEDEVGTWTGVTALAVYTGTADPTDRPRSA